MPAHKQTKATLEARGSWRAKAKKGQPRQVAKPKSETDGNGLDPLEPTPANWSMTGVAAYLGGYDPVATAGECTFDADAAARAVGFFPGRLKFIEGERAGRPFDLEPWQQAIIATAFGWKRPDGRRRYREVFIYVPRKNGKTPLAAGIVLLVGFMDGEPGAQIYSAASEREQAALVFRHAQGMTLDNPDLAERTKIYRSYKCIEWPKSNTFFRSISADANTKHGFNTHAAIVDELHAHRDRDLVDVLTTSTGSRRQPLIVYITTADFAQPSICNEKYEYACKVRDGLIDDPAFLPVIYEAAATDDWTSEATWAKANPNLGVSVNLEYLKRECQRAQEVPSYENTFKRLHLNIRTEQARRWLQMEAWDACGGAVDPNELKGKACWAGLDLSTTGDIAPLVLVFPPDSDSQLWRLLPFFWVPGESMERRYRRDRVPYPAWQKAGLIEPTSGNVIDYERIEARVIELHKTYAIQEIAFDPYNATATAQRLQAAGFNMVEFRQGFQSMNEPTKALERLVTSKKLAHGGNPVLRWMASNVAVLTDPAGNIKPSKQHSTEKIDGIVATIMGLGRALLHVDEGPSVYASDAYAPAKLDAPPAPVEQNESVYAGDAYA